MISVGDALLKLGVDTKDLDKGMKGLGARIKKHQRAIGLAMAAAGSAILAAGVMSVKIYAKMGDEVEKMAYRTGFSAEALSELRHAAEISGAELSTLEKGVKRMAKTIVDASEGMATYIRSFDRIGISVEDLMGLKPEEQFDKITMAIAALEDDTIKAATAQDIFGRAGTALLPLLAQGADGIARLREEAHELGIVFDQEAAESAAELTDTMLRLTRSVDGMKFALAEELIPTLTPYLKSVTESIKRTGQWADEQATLSGVFHEWGRWLGFFWAEEEEARTQAILLGNEYQKALAGMSNRYAELLEELPNLTEAHKKYIEAVRVGNEGLEETNQNLLKQKQYLEDLAKWQEEQARKAPSWFGIPGAGAQLFGEAFEMPAGVRRMEAMAKGYRMTGRGELPPGFLEAYLAEKQAGGRRGLEDREIHVHMEVDGKEVAEAIVDPLGDMVEQRSEMGG